MSTSFEIQAYFFNCYPFSSFNVNGYRVAEYVFLNIILYGFQYELNQERPAYHLKHSYPRPPATAPLSPFISDIITC